MTLFEIASAVSGKLLGNDVSPNTPITDVTIDTRTAQPGALYVPIVGEHFDGHDFIRNARAKGVSCVLSAHPLDDDGPYILVADTLIALQDIAAYYRNQFDIPIIGITGSVGKTSTKEMLAAALSTGFTVLKTDGSFNNQTGVPLTIFRLDRAHEVAIIEMGTNHFGEIAALTKIVQPTICLFTNIGVAHIEFFGSREGIFKGKTEMLHGMRPGGTILVNGDDDLLVTIPNALRYGRSESCDMRATDIVDLGLDGSQFTAHFKGEQIRVHVPAPGLHSVSNALAAMITGKVLGMTLEQLSAGVEGYRAAPGRMCIHHTEHLTIIDDSYNANPNSVMASIDVIKMLGGRRVCILGDMLELGEQSPLYHAEVGSYAARGGIDLVLSVGTYGQFIFEGASAVNPQQARFFETQDALLAALPSILADGDTVLVKASRGMHLENAVRFLLELSKCSSFNLK
ncbi:MAG: UDP-N-acetylmuramoyl-tripeptide--D-alanyl-D-alanine ligase [Clostridia bacterium]